MIIIIIVFYTIVSFIQIRSMAKRKLWKEISVYSTIMLIAFVYSLAVMYNWNLPTISKVTTQLFNPIAKGVFNKLAE